MMFKTVEYELLLYFLNDGYRYITKDWDGNIYLFAEKPYLHITSYEYENGIWMTKNPDENILSFGDLDKIFFKSLKCNSCLEICKLINNQSN